MTTERLIKNWYRCLKEDDSLWCETSSLAECLQQGALSDEPVHYEVRGVFQYDGPWVPYSPNREVLEAAQTAARLIREEQDAES